jgi:hypothetical protein
MTDPKGKPKVSPESRLIRAVLPHPIIRSYRAKKGWETRRKRAK